MGLSIASNQLRSYIGIVNLHQLIKLITSQTLVVLDIDSTLVQTHKRNEAVLRRFAKDAGIDSSHSGRHLFGQSECFPFEYGYAQALHRLGVADEDLKSQVAHYWRKHFFSNEFLHCDLPHDGAQDFVGWLNQKWIPHVYLTGRPHPLMWEGTLKTLQALQFPVTTDNLYLKPHPQDVDELFKSQKMAELKKGYSKVIFIDNEPKVLNQIDKDHPEIVLVFVDTCHSPNVVPPASALKIKDFRELVQLLKA
jgi:phosphoglycolate phosphatase-like HAD superfamily hydrolase